MFVVKVIVINCINIYIAEKEAKMSNVEVHYDVVYSLQHHNKCKMDIFYPKHTSKNTCLVIFHGGAFWSGDKQGWYGFARYFAKRGYTCACVQYRKTIKPSNMEIKSIINDIVGNSKDGIRIFEGDQFPAQIEDVRKSISFLKTNAKKYNLDSDKLITVGASAGGYLAIIAAMIEKDDLLGYGSELNNLNTKPMGVIAYCPLLDVRYEGKNYKKQIIAILFSLMGRKETEASNLYNEASPILNISGNEPPILIIHGQKDKIISVNDSRYFVNKINELGGKARLLIDPDAGHNIGHDAITRMEKENEQRYLDEIERFIEVLIQ